MTIFILIIVFLGIIALEVPTLVKNSQWRELAAFGILMLGAMAVTFAYVLGLPVPNPTKGIEAMVNFTAGMLKKILS
ncbi:hypothetical protein [Phosphitispora sp. TUW77]|uniref:hypothetical protein n=1 Tax=Phosphitispora sp. TUW77 TaxID=3152361 RepID=UPI003AB4B0C3